MKLLLTFILLVLCLAVDAQTAADCPVTEKVLAKTRLEICGVRITNSISIQQLFREGFSLQTEDGYKVKEFAVIVPCRSGWLMDITVLRFKGNIVPPNTPSIKMLYVGDLLYITEIKLEKKGQCYQAKSISMDIVE